MVDENRDRYDMPAQQPGPTDRDMRNDSQHSSAELEHGSDLGQYRKLTARVRSALRPVKPSVSFRQTLGRELSEAARLRHGGDLRVASPSSRRELLIGAAIASVVAVAGGIIHVIRSHMQARSRKTDDTGA